MIFAIAIGLSPAWGAEDGDSLAYDHMIDGVSVVHYTPPLSGDGVGELRLDAEAVERLPQFFSSPDALRTLQLMPGVQTTGDIASGLYVQGCQPVHNLMLLNGAPIYSPVHLIGFISTINNDHLESVTLYKSDVGAQYGGRLASVVDIETLARQPERVEASVNVGLLNSGVTINAPLGERSNVVVSGRVAHINPMLSLVESLSQEPNVGLRYGMNDANLTWNFAINDRNLLTFNGYYSRDVVDVKSYLYNLECDLAWCNAAASMQWHHTSVGGNRLTATLYGSHFDDRIGVDQQVSQLDMESRLDEVGMRIDQQLAVGSVGVLSVGGESGFRRLIPQEASVSSFIVSELDDSPMENLESALYASLQSRLSQRVVLNVGLRYGGVWGVSDGWEPRINVSWQMARDLCLKGGYTRQYQYLSQALVSGSAMPTNYFLLTTEDTPAQRSDNLTLEMVYNNPSRTLQISAMAYDRRLENQYENTTQMTELLIENIPFTERFTYGSGHNFGIESMVRLDMGAVSGWVSYTLSWALRSMEAIDNGATFYASNDRRHDLSVTAAWQARERWNIASSFVLASGQPFTQAMGIYTIGEVAMLLYSSKNGGRMPIYHRMDLTVSHDLEVRWAREAKLVLSIYNLYGRENGVFFHNKVRYDDVDTPSTTLDDVISVRPYATALFTLLPSIGFNCKF
ncbi:MAG: TonB-dependent receptor [Rikenellaceae bacterium]